jgi:CubicO group peptidase (beta-lactamase class C family)
MKRRTVIQCAWLAATAGLLAAQAPRPHGDEAIAAGLIPDVLARIDVEMERQVADNSAAGILALLYRNGHRGYFEAFGMQDIEAAVPMQKDAIFRLMSMTKPVIALAALTLYDAGMFTLDEPISRHCPEWAAPQVWQDGRLVPARAEITPRMLMSHSSGLYYGRLEGAPTTGAAAKLAYEANLGRPVTLRDYSEAVAKDPLAFHPGEGYQYGTSIDILGRYLEAVAGKPLDEILQERLLGPLQMADTAFWVHPEKLSRLSQLYRQPSPGVLVKGMDAAPPTRKPTLMLGGHGLFSTAEDYERFCRMILNRGELDGVRVLQPETVDLIFENHLKIPGEKYGLGGAVDSLGGYSWGGAHGTQFWIDRSNRLCGVFMVQTQGYRSPAYNEFRRLAKNAIGGPQ